MEAAAILTTGIAMVVIFAPQFAPQMDINFMSFFADSYRPAAIDAEVSRTTALLDSAAPIASGWIIGHHADNIVSYRFITSRGNYIGEQAVDLSDFERLEDNTPVNIQYLQDNPSISRLAG